MSGSHHNDIIHLKGPYEFAPKGVCSHTFFLCHHSKITVVSYLEIAFFRPEFSTVLAVVSLSVLFFLDG